MYTFRMYLRGNMRRLYAFFSVALVVLIGVHVNAQSRQLTAEELRGFGVDPNAMTRPFDIKVMFGGCEFNPYPILETKYKANRNAQVTPRANSDSPTLRQGISPALACRLVKFFQHAEQARGCQLKISSAYRSAQQQEDMCGSGRTGCAAAGRSCHQYGLAVDVVGPASCISWARSFLGTKNPGAPGAQQFQLHFPYSGDHIQCSENNVASCNPGTKQCDGSSRVIPELAHTPSPTATFSDSIRQWLAPQQQMQAAPSQPAVPSQPVSTSQNPLDSFNPQPAPTTPITTPTTTATTSNTAADRLEELAFGGKPTTTTATATSVPLVVSNSDAVSLVGTQQASTTAVTPTQGMMSPSQTTFTSGDLAWQDQTISSSPVSGLQAVIISIRAALNRVSQYMVPFGARGDVDFENHDHAEIVE